MILATEASSLGFRAMIASAQVTENGVILDQVAAPALRIKVGDSIQVMTLYPAAKDDA